MYEIQLFDQVLIQPPTITTYIGAPCFTCYATKSLDSQVWKDVTVAYLGVTHLWMHYHDTLCGDFYPAWQQQVQQPEKT